MWSYFCKVNLYKVLTTFTVTTLALNHTQLAPFPVLLRSSPENELDHTLSMVSLMHWLSLKNLEIKKEKKEQMRKQLDPSQSPRLLFFWRLVRQQKRWVSIYFSHAQTDALSVLCLEPTPELSTTRRMADERYVDSQLISPCVRAHYL